MQFRGSFQPGPPSLRVFCIRRLRHGLFNFAIITPELPAVNGYGCTFTYFTLGKFHLYTVAKIRRAKITIIAAMAERKAGTPSHSRR